MKEDKLIKQFITLGIITALVLICAVCCMVSVIQGYLFGYSEVGLMIIGVILCILLIVAFSIFDYVLVKEYIKDYEDEQKDWQNRKEKRLKPNRQYVQMKRLEQPKALIPILMGIKK